MSLRCDFHIRLSVLALLWVLGCMFQLGVYANSCTITEIDGHDVTTRLQKPLSTGVLDYPVDIVHDSERRLNVAMCPDKDSLKITMNIHTPEESRILNMTLCYKMNAIIDGRHLETHCFELEPIRSLNTITVSCWFRIDHIKERPFINAWAISRDSTGSQQYVGFLNTALLDPDRPCDNICEITVLSIPNLLSCKGPSYIRHKKEIRIERVKFVQPGDVQKDLDISHTTDGTVQYSLNCTKAGEANIQVLYMIRDQFCQKYQPVRVLCPKCQQESPTTDDAPSSPQESFGTFVIYGVICIATTSLIVVLVIAVVQNKDRILNICRRTSTAQDPESFPMHPNNRLYNRRHRVNFDLNPSSSTPPNVNRQRAGSLTLEPIVVSRTPSPRPTSSAKTARLQRSATMALLETTDPLDRKKILFLPSIWDQFSRDVTMLLKRVFTEGAKITAQCCYDRDIYQQYMTGDKYKWIETILGDRDKIVVFLCFTKLGTKEKYADEIDIVEDVLSHLLRTRNVSHLLCKVVYLHLTDSEDSHLEQNHHGDSYRISSKESLSPFLKDTLTNCGLRPDKAVPLAKTLFESTQSAKFLSFIGIGERKHFHR